MSDLFLSILVFLPAAAAIVVALMPKSAVDGIRLVTLGATAIVLGMAIYMCWPGTGAHQFDVSVAEMQQVFNIPWIPSFDIDYFLGGWTGSAFRWSC